MNTTHKSLHSTNNCESNTQLSHSTNSCKSNTQLRPQYKYL